MALPITLVVLLVLGCWGYAFLRPAYDRHQLKQAYQEVDFHVVGFFPSPGAPHIHDHPLRVEELWFVDLDLVSQEDFVERSLDSLYDWSRNAGSGAPREDFAECYASDCRIGWVYHGSHEIEIAMFADYSVELVPTWELWFRLQPL